MNKRKANKNNRQVSIKPDKEALSWISGAIFILGIAIIAGFYLEKNAIINEVRFTGYYFTSESELEEAFEAPVGFHPDSVEYVNIINSVNDLPFVYKTGVRVESSGRMIVSIEERTPLAMIVEGNNRMYIDADGVMMPVLLEKNVDVPLLHGLTAGSAADTLAGREFEHVQQFLQAAKESEFGWLTISEVTYDQNKGVVALSHQNGVKLLFGRGNFDNKLNYWEAFYSDIIRREGIGHLASVDLRFSNQIVTREL